MSDGFWQMMKKRVALYRSVCREVEEISDISQLCFILREVYHELVLDSRHKSFMSVLHPAYMDFLIAGLLSEGFIKSRMKFYDSAAMEDMGLVKRNIKHRNVLGSFLYGDAFFNQVEQIIICQKFFKRFTFRPLNKKRCQTHVSAVVNRL